MEDRVHDRAALKQLLDHQYESFNIPDSATDPIQIVRRFDDPADREIVAFLASGLAFGRVASVMASVERVLRAMPRPPAEFVERFEPWRDAAILRPLVHRWLRGPDLVALMLVLQHMRREHGSIEGAFLAGHDADAHDVAEGLERFTALACSVDVSRAYGRAVPAQAGFRYFFPRPSKGSGCKRLNLFLRWMVRHDAIDPGGWTGIRPAQLIVPLDTHIVRIGRCLRLTRYTSPGWKMAREITDALRELDPEDPVRYDFALCHLGMMKACGFGTTRGDAVCPLRGWCRPGARGSRKQTAR